MSRERLIICAILLFFLGGAQVFAAETVAVHRDWQVVKGSDGDGTVCYASSPPLEAEPANVRHGNNAFFVVNRPSSSVFDDPHFRAGYMLKGDSKVTVDIDGKQYNMFTHEQGAWLKNTEEAKQMISLMKKGRDMYVSGVSARGTKVRYRFSLLGVTKAIEQASSSCR